MNIPPLQSQYMLYERHIRKQVKHLTYSFLRMCKLKDASHYFHVKIQLICLTGLWIRLWYKLVTWIRNYSGPHFSAFGLNAATQEFRIQSKCGRIWTKITPNKDTVYIVLNISGTLKTVQVAGCSKFVWPFFSIMPESVTQKNVIRTM